MSPETATTEVTTGVDRGTDGSECRSSGVLTYEPPSRVTFSWDINRASEIAGLCALTTPRPQFDGRVAESRRTRRL
ncbi:MAG TPA: hypothetical protein VHX15_14700 [Frankiaceae bacterium]|jgi:hypothetical protein|nr:hypothetical protein [Frankiaceae bacterium]